MTVTITTKPDKQTTTLENVSRVEDDTSDILFYEKDEMIYSVPLELSPIITIEE